MAVGTITRRRVDPHGGKTTTFGDLKVTVSNVVGPASYTTGGDALSAKSLGLKQVLFADTEILSWGASNAATTKATYNVSAGTLQFYATTGAASGELAVAEQASTNNLAGVTVQITAYGD